MQYWGKIIGVAFAIIMGAGFWGIVLGLIIGHMFDKARSRKMAWFANQRERQSLFFSTTFEVMGHLTKSKGRVTEADIQIASVFMDRMNLHGDSRLAAQNAFRIGKADNYPLRDKMRQFRSICFGRFDLIRCFWRSKSVRRLPMVHFILMNAMFYTLLRKNWASPVCSSTSSCA